MQNGRFFRRERELRRKLVHVYKDIISVENLLVSFQEFLHGKRAREDVILFELNLMDNILLLHSELVNKTYQHGEYISFKINDPKPRDIHKASVRDRLLHHAIYRIIYPYFDGKFIFDSYSCRKNKGTHKALNRFHQLGRKISANNTKTAWILKCDIRKFFASIDHQILKVILKKYIWDDDLFWLLEQVINSFNPGLPLGNLTSQILVNIYMNEFDQSIKRMLKIKHYIRYADDFVILHKDKKYLINIIPTISEFLKKELRLSLNPNKISIKTLASGVDFLGWIHFPNHRVLRTSSKKRMLRRLEESKISATINSYLGLLKHGNSFKLVKSIKEEI